MNFGKNRGEPSRKKDLRLYRDAGETRAGARRILSCLSLSSLWLRKKEVGYYHRED